MKMTIKWIIIFIAILMQLMFTFGWTGNIVFEDNFNGNSLNLNKWEYQESCGNIFGGNNLQCYVRDNVKVRDGKLIITAKKESKEDKNYTSGRIRQIGTGHTYGAYVIRARLARGDHLWPAIWLLNNDDSCRYEEIDIAEYRGQLNQAKLLDNAAHWGRSWDHLTSKGNEIKVPYDLSLDFHEFAVLWLPGKLEWYVDNQKYTEVSLEDPSWTSKPNNLPCSGDTIPFSKPSKFILNLAVGGGFFEHFTFNPNTWRKPSMEIDWVRVYQE